MKRRSALRPSVHAGCRDSSSTSWGTNTAVGSSDEDLGASIEDLEISTCRSRPEVGDQIVGVHIRGRIPAPDPRDLRRALPADTVEASAPGTDVLGNGEIVGEHEMLEDHADSCLDRIGRAVRFDLLPVDPDGALVLSLRRRGSSSRSTCQRHSRRRARARCRSAPERRCPCWRRRPEAFGDPGDFYGQVARMGRIVAFAVMANLLHSTHGHRRWRPGTKGRGPGAPYRVTRASGQTCSTTTATFAVTEHGDFARRRPGP